MLIIKSVDHPDKCVYIIIVSLNVFKIFTIVNLKLLVENVLKILIFDSFFQRSLNFNFYDGNSCTFFCE